MAVAAVAEGKKEQARPAALRRLWRLRRWRRKRQRAVASVPSVLRQAGRRRSEAARAAVLRPRAAKTAQERETSAALQKEPRGVEKRILPASGAPLLKIPVWWRRAVLPSLPRGGHPRVGDG